MHLSLFTTFCPLNILVCPPNICDVSAGDATALNQFYTVNLFNFAIRN